MAACTTSFPQHSRALRRSWALYLLECNLISGNGSARHHSNMRLSIPMSSLHRLSSPSHPFNSLNLYHWWKCNVSCLNLDRRIDNLKWHPLIWSPVYVYGSDWRLIGSIYFPNILNSSFTSLHFPKTLKLLQCSIPYSLHLCRKCWTHND